MTFDRLRLRLTWLYALTVIALIVAITVVGTIVLLREAGRGVQERVQIAASDLAWHLPGTPGLYRDNGNIDEIGVNGDPSVAIIAPFSERIVFALLGVHPEIVTRDGSRTIVVPKIHWLLHILNRYLFAALLLILIASLLGWFAARYLSFKALAPLLDVARSLDQLAAGRFEIAPIAADERSELGRLAGLFNHAAQTVHASIEERRRSESMTRQFVADAGHQLRTPLTVILGYVDALAKPAELDSARRARMFDVMTIEGRRMRRLIDQLLTLARMDREEEPAIEPVRVGLLIESLRDEFEFRPDAPTLRLHLDEDAIVEANGAELYESFFNLLDNAAKYGAQAPIDITVRGSNGTVSVAVEDRGPGIAEQERAHVFDRFYRGESASASEGSGLGLTIAKRGIERARGSITIEDVIPSGTRVIATFREALL